MPDILDLIDEIYFPHIYNYTMNNRTVQIYKFRDFYFYYIYPFVIFFGFAQSLICSIVLAQKELRSGGLFFQYSLVNAVNATIGAFFAAFVFLANCGALCPTAYLFPVQLYKLVIICFLITTLYFHSSLVQIVISLNLYFTLVHKCKRIQNLSMLRVIFGISFISISYGIFYALSFTISSVVLPPSETEYFYTHLNTARRIHAYISIFMALIFNQMFLVVLVIINVLILIEMRRIMKKKENMEGGPTLMMKRMSVTMTMWKVAPSSTAISNSKDLSVIGNNRGERSQYDMIRKYAKKCDAERKMLIMFLWISLCFCSSRFIDAIYGLVVLFASGTLGCAIIEVVNYFWSSIVYSTYFYVYFRTNLIFRRTFLRIFCRKKSND